MAFEPTTSANAGEGVIGLMNAAFGFLLVFFAPPDRFADLFAVVFFFVAVLRFAFLAINSPNK